jgi:signal peptidase I
MSGLNPGINASAGTEIRTTKTADSRGLQATTAAFLSLLFPGLGQLWNLEPWKGFFVAVSFPVLAMMVGITRILLSFTGMLAAVVGMIAWRIWICVDAARVARRGAESKKSFRQAPLAFVVLGSLIVASGVGSSSDYFLHKLAYFRAFRVPSSSFCPTICDGERVVADMGAYLKSPPKKDDVIMFQYRSANGPLYIKRVIGVEGDVISGKDGVILVNGKPFAEYSRIRICGQPIQGYQSGGELPRFDAVKVPSSSFFVVGDNSTNSYDSRIAGFGLVSLDQIRGRPVYIYWSTGKSRIGCPVN